VVTKSTAGMWLHGHVPAVNPFACPQKIRIGGVGRFLKFKNIQIISVHHNLSARSQLVQRI